MNSEAKQIAADVEREFGRLDNANYYDALSLPRTAAANDVRQRFRELAKKYHADRYANLGLPREVMAKMTELLGIISRAHAVLTNPEKRQEYDATLDLAAAGIPSDLGTIMEAESLFRSGRSLLDRGLYETALEKLDRAAELNPVEPEYAATAAFCKYWTMERDSRGRAKNRALTGLIVEHIANYLKENTRNDNACVYLALIAKSEEDSERAMEYFREALAINPRNLIAARELRLFGMRKKKAGGFLNRIFGKKDK